MPFLDTIAIESPLRPAISSISFAGKASGDGLPADKEITSGSPAYLKISLIALGFKFLTLSEKLYSKSITRL